MEYGMPFKVDRIVNPEYHILVLYYWKKFMQSAVTALA